MQMLDFDEFVQLSKEYLSRSSDAQAFTCVLAKQTYKKYVRSYREEHSLTDVCEICKFQSPSELDKLLVETEEDSVLLIPTAVHCGELGCEYGPECKLYEHWCCPECADRLRRRARKRRNRTTKHQHERESVHGERHRGLSENTSGADGSQEGRATCRHKHNPQLHQQQPRGLQGEDGNREMAKAHSKPIGRGSQQPPRR